MKCFFNLMSVLAICTVGFAQQTAVLHQTNTLFSNYDDVFANNAVNAPINFSSYTLSDLSAFDVNSSKAHSTDFNAPFALMLQDSTTAKPKWYKTDTGISLLVAGGLITAGTIMHFNYDFKVGVKDEINRYLPDFHNPIDDYTQYIPYAAVFALDAAGIRSKHSTYRKLSTIATAAAINLVVVQGMKYSIAEPRPDGSSNNSFPSGHTATAFMGAHIFHKEYKHRSPFYSIAAYTLATFTGVFRQLNNRHWVSDVFAGAGIGIGTTELAYLLNDGWWKEKGINEIEATERVINEGKPSFLGVKVGYASLVNSTVGEVPGLESKQGFKIAFEGAYFFNKNFGVGGEIGFQSFPNDISPSVEAQFEAAGYDVIAQSAGNRMYYFGPYYQIPFGKNAIGARLYAGVISGPNQKIYIRENVSTLDFDEENPPQEYVYADFDPSSSFSYGTGMYYRRVLNKNLSIGAYFDYNIADLKYDVTYIDVLDEGIPTYVTEKNQSVNYDSYALGVNVNILLW
ncbi:MAG: phosphatase PAP2 family protein [Flavobacteriaceae bacterium]|nr:phosphatase PAP2 family protein [Flavobacteriaceae bacterium]